MDEDEIPGAVWVLMNTSVDPARCTCGHGGLPGCWHLLACVHSVEYWAAIQRWEDSLADQAQP